MQTVSLIFFISLFLVSLVAWLRERHATELHGTVAESLGMFLFSTGNAAPLGCAPSPDPRSLLTLKPGLSGMTFEFGAGRILCLSLAVSGSLLKKRKRVDLVVTPGDSESALHVTMSADGLPPVFDGEVRFVEATVQAPFYLGAP